MIAQSDLVLALTPFLSTFAAKLSDDQWEQYGLALREVNPGDLDDALADLRKSHGFRNAPLPAEILARCDVHRKRRSLNVQPVEPDVKADPNDGEWKTLTLKGIGSVRMHVLPDHHPALKRYACTRCKDLGWEECDINPNSQPTYRRCGCVARNPVLQEQRTKSAEYARKKSA